MLSWCLSAGMNHIHDWSGFRLVITAALLLAPCAWAEKVPIGDELERLSAVHGFNVIGLDVTEDAMGRTGGAELYPRLRRLLENFDHVIVQGRGGGIDRVIILGETVPFVPAPRIPSNGRTGGDEAGPGAIGGDILLKTERSGTQHSVEVSLEGAKGKRVSRTLLVDTGADFVVLPSSVISDLGIDAAKLEEREMQTANGKVEARVGILPALWLGEARIADPIAAFIDDGKLGNGGLLGMSVLGRYTMTIDDEAGTLTLASKTGVAAKDDAEGEVAGEVEASEIAKKPAENEAKTPDQAR
jgi:clan AA aspartic protease (TIGR02281 family)